METAITFTLSQALAALLAACGAIVSIAAAAGVIWKIVMRARKPNEEQDKRLDAIEKRLTDYDAKFEEYDGKFASDKNRLDKMKEGNRVTQQAILALLAHAIDGNNIEELKDAKDALQQYLINR